MLLEGICKYEIEMNNQIENISKVRVIKVGMAITEKEYVLADEDGVVVQENKIVIFRTDKRSSKVFEIINYISGENQKSHPPEKCKIVEFLSIYPTTNILFANSRIHFHFEQPCRTCKDLLLELRAKHPKLTKTSRGIYFIDGVQEGTTKARYTIKAKDGEIEVDISVLKSKNVTGLYCIRKIANIGDLRRIDNEETGRMNVDNTNTLNESKHKEKLNDNEKLNDKVNASTENNEIVETKFEFVNSQKFLVLIRVYLRHFTWPRYSCYKHFLIQSLDTFYFTFLKVEKTVMVIVSRQLYDFTLLFNLIIEDQSQAEKVLQIPLLSTRGIKSVTFRDKSLIKKYNFNRVSKHLRHALMAFDGVNGILPDKTVIEHNEYSFWCIQRIILLLKPMTFPGLIICSLLREMNYLLHGPYPLIISIEDGTILEEFTRNKENARCLILSSKKKAQVFHNLGFLGYEKKDIISTILKSKLKSLNSKIPINAIVFPNSNTIIKYFLNQVKSFDCVYSFNLQDGISFSNRTLSGNTTGKKDLASFSYENALSLWLMLYPYEIDYSAVVKENRFSLLFLLRRACIDNNKNLINQILFLYVNEGVLKEEPFYDLHFSPEYVLNDILMAIGSYDKWVEIEKSRYLKDIEVSICSSFYFICDQKKYEILSIDNVLGCIQHGVFNIQVHGSVMAYFKEYGFPLDCSKIKDPGDYAIFL